MSTPTQKEFAEKAQAEKAQVPKADHPQSEPTADTGMNPQPNTDIAPSGAFDAEGHKPVVERTRSAR